MVAKETSVFIQFAPKPYAAFPPPQLSMRLNFIMIDQLASEILTFSPFLVYGKYIRPARVCNSETNNSIWTEIELVLITCKFEEDPIKNEDTIVSTTFFPVLKGA